MGKVNFDELNKAAKEQNIQPGFKIRHIISVFLSLGERPKVSTTTELYELFAENIQGEIGDWGIIWNYDDGKRLPKHFMTDIECDRETIKLYTEPLMDMFFAKALERGYIRNKNFFIKYRIITTAR